MTLLWGDELEGTVEVLAVIPGDEACDPGAGVVEGLEGAVGIGRGVLEGTEQGVSLLTEDRLKKGITPRRCRVASRVTPFMGRTDGTVPRRGRQDC
jgi:hypothetical protein